MKAAWAWVSGLFGNSPAVKIMIFAFLAVLVFFAIRCSADETQVHLTGGTSFGCLRSAPVLGIEVITPIEEGLAWDTGITIWGKDSETRNNWDVHGRIKFSRGPFGAAIGAAFLQNIDAVNGSHAEMSLMLYWHPWRLGGVDVIHLSNAGTTRINCGRNAALADVRLR
jgi:hypothetical protein